MYGAYHEPGVHVYPYRRDLLFSKRVLALNVKAPLHYGVKQVMSSHLVHACAVPALGVPNCTLLHLPYLPPPLVPRGGQHTPPPTLFSSK